MNSAQVLDLINDLEDRYPVAQWQIGQVYVWPILRARLYTAIVNFYLLPADQHPASRYSLLRRVSATPLNLLRMLRAIVCDFRRTRLRLRSADILILSDGTSFAEVESVWHDRIMDPIVRRASSHGQSSFIMSPGWLSLNPRQSASLFVQVQFESCKVWATLWQKLFGINQSCQLGGVEALLSELRTNEYSDVIPTSSWLLAHSARIFSLADYFSRALRSVKPAIALVNTYYSAEGFAFCMACRRAGVPIADVQHGSQGRDHMAYGRWSAVPLEGYETMPDRFWCWDDNACEAIAEWSRGTRHTPIVAGNAWQSIWKDGDEPFVGPLLAKAGALRQESRAKHHVAITISWGYADEEVAKIFRAASRLSRGDYFWWVRLHPAQIGQEAHYATLARTAGLKDFEIDHATTLPLYAVLSTVDLVVAPGSTTVMEAEDWGLRSVVTSEYGVDLCKAAIASGAAIAAVGEAEIESAIVSALAKGLLPAASRVSGADRLDFALEDLFSLQSSMTGESITSR